MNSWWTNIILNRYSKISNRYRFELIGIILIRTICSFYDIRPLLINKLNFIMLLLSCLTILFSVIKLFSVAIKHVFLRSYFSFKWILVSSRGNKAAEIEYLVDSIFVISDDSLGRVNICCYKILFKVIICNPATFFFKSIVYCK